MKSTVVIALTSYNDGELGAAAARSIDEQTGLERISQLILADDASTNDTVAQIRGAWSDRIPLVQLETPRNLGPWPNLNRVMHHGCGLADWVIVFHADDYVAPGWLDETLARIEGCADDVGTICSSWNTVFGPAVHAGENSKEPFRRVPGGTAEVASTLMRGCWWKLSGAAIRSKAFLDAGDFDARYAQCGDWEWLLRLQARGWATEYIPRSLVNYRQHAATMSTRALIHDTEVIDALRLLDAHAGELTRAQRARFLSQRMGFLTRRLARATLNANPARAMMAVRTMTSVTRAFARHVLT